MNSSFQLEVKLMYREFMKIIYSKAPDRRQALLEKTRSDFKAWANIPRREIGAIDFAFHSAARQLHQLKSYNIDSMSFYTPKPKK
jgi:hypothetical protein